MNNQEQRSLESGFEVRKEDDKVVVEGYAARFDDETVIGGKFAERVARGAFEGADMSNTVALFNHDWNMPLARVGNGLELSVDEVGLRYRFELGDQSYAKDLAENIRMGNVSTSSFGFTVADDSWERRDGMNLRTINSVGTLFDVSPTTQGAYPTTEVGLRSMEAALEIEVPVEVAEAPVVEEVVEEVVAEEVPAEEVPAEEPAIEEVVESEEEDAEERAYDEEEDEEEKSEEPADEEEAEERKLYKAVEEEKPEPKPKKKKAKKTETNSNKDEETRNNSISEMENSNTAPAVVQGLGDSEARAAKDFNFGKFIKEAAKGNVTGLEAEMTQEGSNEMRNSGVNVAGGYNIPSMVLRSMGTADGASGSTAFGGGIEKLDNGIVENYAPSDIASKLGVRNLSGLSGDVAMQVQSTLTAAGADVAEGAIQTEALPLFAEKTLSPTRYAAHVGLTQQLLAQSGDDMAAFVQMDIRRALDKQFNAAILAAIVAADTELAYASNNPLDVEEALLAADVDLADVRFVAAADAYRTFRSLSLDAGSGNLFANDPKSQTSIIGFSGIVSSQAATGKAHFFDRNQMVTGQWGGMNLIVDPYTDAARGVVRVIANEYRDVQTLQHASFQTITGA
jgi:HK97 family phage prohead protease